MAKLVSNFSGGNASPISEGGTWLNGLTDAGNNQNMQIVSAHAVGTAFNPTNYDDNIACRLPIFGADQWAQATVYRASGYNPTTAHELELWLRTSMSTASGGTMRGYEFMFNSHGGGDFGYWAGPGWPSSPPDPFVFVTPVSGPGVGGDPQDGDVFRAEIHSSLMMLFRNNIPVMWATDTARASGGAPGMGVFTRGGDTVLASFGFKDHIAADENFPTGLTNKDSVSQAAASSISIPTLVASGPIAPTINNSLIVGVLSASATNTVNAPTWAAGSGAVTKIGEATGSGGIKISVWQIQNPNPTTDSTTQNVTVTASGPSLVQAFCWLVCNSDISATLSTADSVSSTAVSSPISLTASNLTSSDMSIAVAGVVSTGSLTGLTPNMDYDHDDLAISYMEAAHSFGTGGFSLTNTGVSAGNQAFVVVRIRAIPGPLPAVGHPISDTTPGAWTPSTGGTLFGCIDEVAFDDADFISTPSLSTCEIALNDTAFPVTGGVSLSYRAKSDTGNGITVTLKQGATTIASWSHALTNALTTYTQVLTGPQIASIVAGPMSVTLTST